MQKFLTFDEMVTPSVILIVYWIVIILIVIGALSTLAGGFWAFVMGVVGAAVGLILWRVACEMMLIVFRIHAQLAELIRNTTPPGALPPHPAP
jgi:hypothetical protein